MIISSADFFNSILLFIITTGFIYFILYVTKPDFVLIGEEDKKYFSKTKGIILAVLFSLIFTIIVAFISVKVDQQYARRKQKESGDKSLF